MINRIKDVSESLTYVAVKSQEMNKSIQEVAAASEKSAAGVEESSDPT